MLLLVLLARTEQCLQSLLLPGIAWLCRGFGHICGDQRNGDGIGIKVNILAAHGFHSTVVVCLELELCTCSYQHTVKQNSRSKQCESLRLHTCTCKTPSAGRAGGRTRTTAFRGINVLADLRLHDAFMAFFIIALHGCNTSLYYLCISSLNE